MPNRKCDILEFRKGLEKSITDYETNESRIKHCSRSGRLWSLLIGLGLVSSPAKLS